MLNSYIVLDIETTGLSPQAHQIIELGAIKVEDGKIIGDFSELINPQTIIPNKITEITGINNEMVEDARICIDVIGDFVEFCEDLTIMGHNIMFDYSFIKFNANKYNYEYNKYGIDTLKIARSLLKNLESKSLGYLCDFYGITNRNAHRAYDDAYATKELYDKLAQNYIHTNPDVFKPVKLEYKTPKVIKEEIITAKQKKYLNDLLMYHKIEMKKSLDLFSKREASREIDRIILNYGRIL